VHHVLLAGLCGAGLGPAGDNNARDAATKHPTHITDVTEITDTLRAFVRKHVRTVGELEVLLLLRAHPARTWTADEVACEQRGTSRAAADYLRHFGRTGLAREVDVGQFQYIDDAAVREMVTQLADAYAERPVSVVDLIYSEPRDQVQLLADAFKIKKD